MTWHELQYLNSFLQLVCLWTQGWKQLGVNYYTIFHALDGFMMIINLIINGSLFLEELLI